jgi:hypothetical protein
MERIQPALGELRAAFAALSQAAKLAAGVLVLIVACAFCSLGIVTAPRGSTSTVAASATNTSVASAPRATATTKAPTATATTAKAKAWVTVQHFTGNQNQQTPNFHLPDGSRIVWTASPTDTNANAFSVEMYSSDGSYLDLIANNANATSDQSSTYNVHGDHNVYLKISPDQVNFDIQVQVYQ